MQIDPLAEKHLSFSTYSYCLDNPIVYTDPSGLDTLARQYQGDNLNLIVEYYQRRQAEAQKRWAESGKGNYYDDSYYSAYGDYFCRKFYVLIMDSEGHKQGYHRYENLNESGTVKLKDLSFPDYFVIIKTVG